jgi:hypothetical protein
MMAKAELYQIDDEFVAFVYLGDTLFVTDKIKSGRGLKEFIKASQEQLRQWAAGAAGYRPYRLVQEKDLYLVARTNGKGVDVVDSGRWEQALKHFEVEA